MKKLTASLLLLFLCHFAKAQNNANTGFRTRTNYVFQLLEKDRVPFGLLSDYAMEFAELRVYNGFLTDSNKVNYDAVQAMYRTIYMSKINNLTPALTTPKQFEEDWGNARSVGRIVLGGVFYNYACFKDNAYASGLVSVVNEQVKDNYLIEQVPCDGGGPILNRPKPKGELCERRTWINPYDTRTVLGVAPVINSYSQKSLNIILPSNLFQSNLINQMTNLQMDADDGRGYQPISLGSEYALAYANEGLKQWKFKITLNNQQVFESQSEIYIIPPPALGNRENGRGITDPNSIPITATESYINQLGKALITINYAPSHFVNGVGQLRKPLIVAEGFDVGHLVKPEERFGITGLNSFLREVATSQSNNLQNLLLFNNTQQYDIVYVDWVKGTDFLQRNGLALEEVIRWVNNRKVQVGSTEPNVLLGESMGGVIGRWALRDMELKGQTHQTRLFVSFDGPQLGANVPLTYQKLARHANDIYINNDIGTLLNVVRVLGNTYIATSNFIDMFSNNPNPAPYIPNLTALAEGGLSIIDAPAARQMLINWLGKNSIVNNDFHNAWQTELRQMGYPQQGGIRNVAISNGSRCANTQNIQPGESLFIYSGKFNTTFLGDLIGQYALPIAGNFVRPLVLGVFPGRNDFTAYFRCAAYPKNQSYIIYNGKIDYKKTLFYLIPIETNITDQTFNADPSIIATDHSEGGSYIVPINLQSGTTSTDLLTQNIYARNHPSFNFVPTPSALDIGGGNVTLTFDDYNRRYVRTAPPAFPLNSPFVDFTTAYVDLSSNPDVNYNERHISLSNRNGDFLAANLNNQPYTGGACDGFCSTDEIAGPNSFCGTQTFTSNAPAGSTVTWSISPIPNNFVDLTVNGNVATLTQRAITNPRFSNSGVVTLSANITNPCIAGNVFFTKQVQVGLKTPQYALAATSAQGECIGAPYEAISSYSNTQPVSYNWYVNGILDGSHNYKIRKNFTQNPETVGVMVTNATCGISEEYYKFYYPSSCKTLGTETQVFTLSPNPSNGLINIQALDGFSFERLRVVNKMGVLIRDVNIGKKVSSYQINIANEPSDVYDVQLFDGKVWKNKMVVLGTNTN